MCIRDRSWLDELRSMVGLTTPRRLRRRELLSVRQVTPHELEQVGLGYLSDYYPYLRLWYYTTEPHEYQTLVADYAFETEVKAVYFYDVKMLYADFSELPFLANHMTYSIESKLYNHFWAFSYFFHLPFTTVMLAYLILCFFIIFFLCCGKSLIIFANKLYFFVRRSISLFLLYYHQYSPLFLNRASLLYLRLIPYLHWLIKFVNSFIVTKTARGRFFLIKSELFLPVLTFFHKALLQVVSNEFFSKLRVLCKVPALLLLQKYTSVFYTKGVNFFTHIESSRAYKLVKSKVLHCNMSLPLNLFYFSVCLSTFYDKIPLELRSFFCSKFTSYLCRIGRAMDYIFKCDRWKGAVNRIKEKSLFTFNEYTFILWLLFWPVLISIFF